MSEYIVTEGKVTFVSLSTSQQFVQIKFNPGIYRARQNFGGRKFWRMSYQQ